MAKTRQIQTKFWSDPFIQSLKSEDKYFYLYLLTNEHTNICGVYEITIPTMCFESGLSEDSVLQAVDKLSQAHKITFFDNFVFIHNFVKNQTDNPSVQLGVNREMANLPQKIQDFIQSGYRLGTGSPQAAGYLTKLNLTKPIGTASKDADSKKTPMEYTEPVIQLDEDGEEIAPVQPHSGRFGKYTRLVAQHYADKQNKVVTGQTMGEAKQLLVFIHSEFPEDDNASLAKEAKSAINLTAKYYAELKVENWGLLKVIENWKKI